MSLVLKNHSGPGASDGLTRPSPRTTASMAIRCLITIDVDPAALRAIVDAKLRYSAFKFFPKLPVEVQLMIWEYAVGKGPTMIIVPHQFTSRRNYEKKHPNRVRNGKGRMGKWSGAALLSVCRLSRRVAIRVWGSNVRHIPSPGVYTNSATPRKLQHRDGFMGDLATDMFYWPYAWIGVSLWFDESLGDLSSIAVRYDLLENNRCGNADCDQCPPDIAGPCDTSIGNMVWSLLSLTPHTVMAPTIRRLAMVVEEFGIIRIGKARAPGPVYVTTGGAEFYDVTDGLVDAAGRELFEAGEGKLQELEGAKEIMERIGETWQEVSEELADELSDEPKPPPSFRILVGVKK